MITKVQAMIEQTAQGLQSDATAWRPALAGANDNLGERTRAQEIAQAMKQTLNREANNSSLQDGGVSPSRGPMLATAGNARETSPHVPLGRSYPAPSRRVGKEALKRKPTS
jgi:hypothetical protein